MTDTPPSTSPELTQAQRRWLDSSPVMPERITLKTQGGDSLSFEVMCRDEAGRIHNIPRGFKGFVLRVRNPETHAEYAAKLAVPSDYLKRPPEQEARLTSKLRPASMFVCHEHVGRCAPPAGMPDAAEDFVCFLAPWISGETLHDRLQIGVVEPHFACHVAVEVLKGIRFLQSEQLKHDDLHAGNVMLTRKPEAMALFESDKLLESVWIIDFGSLKPIEQTTRKSRDDWICFVQILVDLFNGLHSNRRVASTYPHFMRRMEQFIGKLTEEDVSRHFPDETHLALELRELTRLVDASDYSTHPSFQPFEAISAEHLADDATLLDLFVATLPWMNEVRENKPVILTGPRGCGKSMIFRYLAVRTHLGERARLADTNGPPPFDSFGVYLSCATHLQNNLSWLAREDGRPAKRAAEISTYFQIVVARELFKTIGFASVDARANATFQLTESGIENLVSHVRTYFPRPIESPRLSSSSLALHFADDLDRVRVRLHTALLRDEAWADNLPDTFLSDLTRKLASEIPYFRTRPVVFLLDDYSSNRVQPAIQQILNKIVFERLPSQYFKISCEKFGFNAEDIDGINHDESREFTIIDAGSKALSEFNDAQAAKFLEKLIDQRLKTAKWQGTAGQLIGTSGDFDQDEKLAEFIRTVAARAGRQYYYFGLPALGRLWSGDTSTLLQIVREMFTRGSVTSTSTKPISSKDQHEAIIAMSRALRGRVEGFHPYGSSLDAILGEFGAAARDILVLGRQNKQDKPYRLYRLEMTKEKPKSTIALLEEVDSTFAAVAKELLRRSIFIELQDSRAKEGPAFQTMRWELRRVFNPAFGLSLQRETYLQVKDINELVTFLREPAQFAKRVRMSYAASQKDDRSTKDLFEGGSQDA